VSPSSPISWCFSTLGCPALRLGEVLRLADTHSIPFVELRALEGRDDLPEYLEKTFGDGLGLVRALAPFRARPLVLSTPLRLVGHETLPDLLPHLAWAGEVRWIRVFDGGTPGQVLTPGQRAQVARCLDWCAERLRERGLQARIVVETHDLLCDLGECRRLLDAVGDRLHLLWDSHHTWRKGGTPCAATWEALRPAIRHIHVKDSIAEAWEDLPYRYVAPNGGDFDLRGLVELLRRDAFAGAVSVEWESRWHPSLGSVEPVLARMASDGWFGPDPGKSKRAEA